jgi:hypothetical protein
MSTRRFGGKAGTFGFLLTTWGERNTVNFSFWVGKGIGPFTMVPVAFIATDFLGRFVY